MQLSSNFDITQAGILSGIIMGENSSAFLYDSESKTEAYRLENRAFSYSIERRFVCDFFSSEYQSENADICDFHVKAIPKFTRVYTAKIVSWEKGKLKIVK